MLTSVWRALGAAIALALCAAPIGAQVSKSTMATNIATAFPDNTTNSITPAAVRTFLNTLVNSYQQYAGIRNVGGTSDTITVADYGQLVLYSNSGAIAVAMPQASGSFATFNVYVRATGAGAVTVTPTTSTINGAATLLVPSGTTAWIVSDGTNYQSAQSFSMTVNGVRIVDLPSNASGFAGISSILIGQNSGIVCTSAGNGCWSSVVIGDGQTGASMVTTGQTVIVGAQAAPNLTQPCAGVAGSSCSEANDTIIGDHACQSCTTLGSSVVVGRGGADNTLVGSNITAIGHAALFFGDNNVSVECIGGAACGNPLTGTVIPVGYPNAGSRTIYGMTSGSDISMIGNSTGLCDTFAHAGALKQSFVIGSWGCIPNRNNVGVLGNGLQAVETAAALWDGTAPVSVSAGAGATLTCAQLLSGIIRTGPGSGFTDAFPTAQQIVQCTTFGVGNLAESNLAHEVVYVNANTGQTATLECTGPATCPAGGVTLNSFGGTTSTTVGTNIAARLKIVVTNTAAGSEAVTIYRVQ